MFHQSISFSIMQVSSSVEKIGLIWQILNFVLNKIARFLQQVRAGSQNIKGLVHVFTFISGVQTNVAKSSCGWSPIWLHCNIWGKKTVSESPSMDMAMEGKRTFNLTFVRTSKTNGQAHNTKWPNIRVSTTYEVKYRNPR